MIVNHNLAASQKAENVNLKNSFNKKLITNETEFLNFPDKITEEMTSLFDRGAGELAKYENCKKRRERLLEKIKINKSQISKLFRAYVEAGKEFGMDIVFNQLLKIFSSKEYYPDSDFDLTIKELWVEDMDEEGVYDFVDEVINICTPTSDIYDKKNKAGISHDLAELVYIMDKDIHGELGSEETALLKKNMAKWQEQIQMMREGLKSMS